MPSGYFKLKPFEAQNSHKLDLRKLDGQPQQFGSGGLFLDLINVLVIYLTQYIYIYIVVYFNFFVVLYSIYIVLPVPCLF